MVVWILLGLAFKEYVNRFSGSRYEENYGNAGWVVILLVVLYLDALVLLIGAEINSEIDFAILKVPRGSRNFRQAEKGERRTPHIEPPTSK
jgi:membrane protein